MALSQPKEVDQFRIRASLPPAVRPLAQPPATEPALYSLGEPSWALAKALLTLRCRKADPGRLAREPGSTRRHGAS